MKSKILKALFIIAASVCAVNFLYFILSFYTLDNFFSVSSDFDGHSSLLYSLFSFVGFIHYLTGSWFVIAVCVSSLSAYYLKDKVEKKILFTLIGCELIFCLFLSYFLDLNLLGRDLLCSSRYV